MKNYFCYTCGKSLAALTDLHECNPMLREEIIQAAKEFGAQAALAASQAKCEEERETFLAEHDENVRLHTELTAAKARIAILEEFREEQGKKMCAIINEGGFDNIYEVLPWIIEQREMIDAAKASIAEQDEEYNRLNRAATELMIQRNDLRAELLAEKAKRVELDARAGMFSGMHAAKSEALIALRAELEAVKAERDRYQDAVVEMLAEAAPIPPEPKPVEKAGESLEEAAWNYVYERFSNNDDSCGDNFGSFKAGALWGMNQGEAERDRMRAGWGGLAK